MLKESSYELASAINLIAVILHNKQVKKKQLDTIAERFDFNGH